MGLKETIQNATASGFKSLGNLRKTVEHIRTGAPDYDPEAGGESGSAETVQVGILAVVSSYKNFEINGSQIIAGDRKVLIPFGSLEVEPVVNDKIKFDGTEYQVKDVGVDPADSVYIFQVGN